MKCIDAMQQMRIILLILLHALQGVEYTLIGFIHSDVEEDREWIDMLTHQSDVSVGVEPLEGRLADIDGKVAIATRNFNWYAPGGDSDSHSYDDRPSAFGGCAPVRSVFFKTGEMQVRWITQINGKDLL